MPERWDAAEYRIRQKPGRRGVTSPRPGIFHRLVMLMVIDSTTTIFFGIQANILCFLRRSTGPLVPAKGFKQALQRSP